MLCKKHGGAHKTHNTRECRRYNKDGTLIKKIGSTAKPHSKERKSEGVNFAQIVRTELRKALRKKSSRRKRRRGKDSESDSDSDNSSWRCGSNSTGELHTSKKVKLETTVNSYTDPSPSKAIQTKKDFKDNKINLTVKKNRTSIKSCSKTKKFKLIIEDKIETMTLNLLKKSYGKKMSVIKQGLLRTVQILPV